MLADRMRMRKNAGKYVMATDSDFSGTTNGTFKYIGAGEYIAIPHIIKGRSVTSYYEMFRDNTSTILKGVASDNPNVTDMYRMFYNSAAISLDLSNFDTSNVRNMRGMFQGSAATSLDLSGFDTSNVTDMSYMFLGSAATTGYARTQADADRFNNSSNKPSALVFVVK